MQQPDDERIRAAYAAFSERGALDADLFHPEVEWHNDPQWPGAGVHRGVEAVQREFSRQRDAWREARYEPVEIVRAPDRIVVLVDVEAKGKSSGAPVSIEGGHIFTLRDGRVVRVQAFTDRDRLLAAAGLAR